MTKRYTKDHEWVELNGDIATVGISTYAAEQLGDVVYAELNDTRGRVAADPRLSAHRVVVRGERGRQGACAPVAAAALRGRERRSTGRDHGPVSGLLDDRNDRRRALEHALPASCNPGSAHWVELTGRGRSRTRQPCSERATSSSRS